MDADPGGVDPDQDPKKSGSGFGFGSDMDQNPNHDWNSPLTMMFKCHDNIIAIVIIW